MRWCMWPLALSACLHGGQVTDSTETSTSPPCDDAVPPWYVDADGDGFGDVTQPLCAGTSGAVVDATDCDDGNAAVHPNRSEICAEGPPRDDDCDPRTADPVASVGDLPFDTLAEAVAHETHGPRTVVVCDWQDLAVAPLGVEGDLTVRSATGQAERVSLTPSTGAIFVLGEQDASLTVRGLTLAGGRGKIGGAIAAASTGLAEPLLFGEVVLVDVVAKGNESQYGGVVAAGTVTVLGSELTGNVALDDGGAVLANQLTMDASTLSDNNAFRGGGVAVRGAATITASTFGGNDARAIGGALFAKNTDSDPDITLQLTGGWFRHNEARQSGGALYVSNFRVIDATGTSFVDNEARSLENPSLGTGGAVFVDALGDSVGTTLVGGAFEDNDAPDGGAVYAVCSGGETVELQQVLVDSNTANAGAAAYFHNGCRAVLTESDLLNNHAAFVGGGVYVGLGGTTLQVTDGSITDNQANLGAALFLVEGAAATLTRTDVWRNNNNDASGAIHALPDKGLSLSFAEVSLGSGPEDNAPFDVMMRSYDSTTPDNEWTLRADYLGSHECDFLGCYKPPVK